MLVIFLISPKVLAQKDVAPPIISISYDALADSFKTDLEIDTTKISKDTLIASISCIYLFPNDYLRIPDPIVIDDTDPSPQVSVSTIFDSTNLKVIRKWTAKDVSGNKSQLTLIVSYSGQQYQLNLNQIIVNNENTILSISSQNDVSKTDSIYFCKNSTLSFKVDASWACAKNKKEFYWNVNNMPVYAGEGDGTSLFLSLDTLPQIFKIEVQANSTIGTNLPLLGLANNKIDFVILQEPGATIDINKPTCNGSADGSIALSNAINYKWDNGTSSTLRKGLNPGKYWVNYSKDTCSVTDTIVLKQDKTISFSVLNTVVDLKNQSYLTIINTSTLLGTFSWKIGDSVFINNNQEFNFNLKKAGNLNINLSLANNICKDDFTDTILVIGSLVNGIPILDNSDLALFPTPSNNEINLILPVEGTYLIKIYNINGTEMYVSKQIISKSLTVPIYNLPNGMYILSAYSDGLVKCIRKFIKIE